MSCDMLDLLDRTQRIAHIVPARLLHIDVNTTDEDAAIHASPHHGTTFDTVRACIDMWGPPTVTDTPLQRVFEWQPEPDITIHMFGVAAVVKHAELHPDDPEWQFIPQAFS